MSRVDFGSSISSLISVGDAFVRVSGGKRGNAIGHTTGSDFPIVRPGKTGPTIVAVRFPITKDNAEAIAAMLAAWYNEGILFLRYFSTLTAIFFTADGNGDEAAGVMRHLVGPNALLGYCEFSIHCSQFLEREMGI